MPGAWLPSQADRSHREPTFDLIAKLRVRRLKWTGQVLRLEPKDSLVTRC